MNVNYSLQLRLYRFTNKVSSDEQITDRQITDKQVTDSSTIALVRKSVIQLPSIVTVFALESIFLTQICLPALTAALGSVTVILPLVQSHKTRKTLAGTS